MASDSVSKAAPPGIDLISQAGQQGAHIDSEGDGEDATVKHQVTARRECTHACCETISGNGGPKLPWCLRNLYDARIDARHCVRCFSIGGRDRCCSGLGREAWEVVSA